MWQVRGLLVFVILGAVIGRLIPNDFIMIKIILLIVLLILFFRVLRLFFERKFEEGNQKCEGCDGHKGCDECTKSC